MTRHFRTIFASPAFWVVIVAVAVTAIILLHSQQLFASDRKLITISVDGTQKTLVSNAQTVDEAITALDIELSESDLVEPSRDSTIDLSAFNINVYRSRPVKVVDESETEVVLTAFKNPRLIAEQAGSELHPADEVSAEVVTDFIDEGFAGTKLVIERATPLTIVADAQTLPVRSQLKTVGEVLAEQGLTLRAEDFTRPSETTHIQEGMTIEVVRVGAEVVAEERVIEYETKVVTDHNMPVGESKIEQTGENGMEITTYEIIRHNETEVSRTLISTVETKKVQHEIIIQGGKPTSSISNNAQLLATLRQCETGGNYQANTGNGYYGAYQFLDSTWDRWNTGYARADYAPPAVQDATVLKNARASSGGFWSQHPGCSKKHNLPKFPY